MKIAVIGSINVDLMYRVAKKHNQGETIIGEDYSILAGGKGANQAVIANALTHDVTFLGAVGNDAFGTNVLNTLNKKGLSLNHIVKKDTTTGLAVIEVFNHDNSIVVFPGANMELTKEDIDHFLNKNKDVEFVISQLEIPYDVVEHLIKSAHKKGIKTVLNPAPAHTLSKTVLDLVDYLIPNETETEVIFKSKNYNELVERYEGRLLITLGSQGVLLYSGNVPIRVPANKINVVDTTGAGDSFIAGFVVGLSKGMGLEKAVHFGVDVAAVTCQYYGAQSAVDDLKERFKRET